MKIKVYQSNENKYIEMETLGKVKYVGENFGIDGLTNNKIYDFVKIDYDNNLIDVVDDSGENYVYQIENPKPLDGSSKGGKWEFIDEI